METISKQDFLAQLGEKLTAIPAPERASILDYYDKHIQNSNDGGEAETIAKLGTPADVAADVLASYVKKMGETPKSKPKTTYKAPSYTWLIVVLVILFAPAILGLTVGLGGGAFSIVVAFGASGISFVITGLASAALAIPIFFQDAGFGLQALGMGFVLIGVGILLVKLTICIAIWIISLVKSLFDKIIVRRRHDHGSAI